MSFSKSSKVIVEITSRSMCNYHKFWGTIINNKSLQYKGIFIIFLIVCIWQCHNFNGSATLPYGSQCEDCHSIALPEKFSHYLSEIIQSSYYATLRKTGMLHFTLEGCLTLLQLWKRKELITLSKRMLQLEAL